MKKSILLIIYVMFLLVGCGSGKNKEQLIKEADKLSWKTISIEKAQNIVAAKEKYNGKICIFEGYIGDIFDEDYIELNWYEGSWMNQDTDIDKLTETDSLRMDLDDEDAKKVHTGDKVKVVGIIDMDSMSTEFNNAFIIE